MTHFSPSRQLQARLKDIDTYHQDLLKRQARQARVLNVRSLLTLGGIILLAFVGPSWLLPPLLALLGLFTAHAHFQRQKTLQAGEELHGMAQKLQLQQHLHEHLLDLGLAVAGTPTSSVHSIRHELTFTLRYTNGHVTLRVGKAQKTQLVTQLANAPQNALETA